MEHGTRKPPGWGGRAGRCETSPTMRTPAAGTTRLGRRLAAAVLGRRGLMTAAAADCDRRRSGRGGGPSVDPPAAAAHRKPSRAARQGAAVHADRDPARRSNSTHHMRPRGEEGSAAGAGQKKTASPPRRVQSCPPRPPPAHWPLYNPAHFTSHGQPGRRPTSTANAEHPPPHRGVTPHPAAVGGEWAPRGVPRAYRPRQRPNRNQWMPRLDEDAERLLSAASDPAAP